jgi:hypothetical protein
MVTDMMKQCCGEDGMPNFEKMKHFMEDCGKERFSDDETQMMKHFCGSGGMPDPEKMKELMEKCGCNVA